MISPLRLLSAVIVAAKMALADDPFLGDWKLIPIARDWGKFESNNSLCHTLADRTT